MKILIPDVIVGERRRQDLGDLDGLAESIDKYGLLHPIVIDSSNTLVAGERRLRACEQLGWREIDAKALGDLTDSGRREIELEENLRRKDLTEFEQSRILLERADVVTRVISEESDLFPATGNKSRGRPREIAPRSVVAERMGVSDSTIARAEHHVDAATSYPFMQGWKQYEVLEARETLDDLPDYERPRVAALISQPGVPAKSAIAIVKNLAAKDSEERARIYDKAESQDSRDRTEALTLAAEMPAMPDPRLALLNDAKRIVRQAIRMFPDDPANEAIMNVVGCLDRAYSTVQESRSATK